MDTYKITYIIIFIIICLYINDDNYQNDFYQNIVIITDPTIDVLVNKNNQLQKDYIPNNLVLIDLEYGYNNKYMVKEAYEQFVLLHNDASILGLEIIIVSAYRSYEYQENLYNGYVESKGLDYADKCSARAGHSEHQTGLAIDVSNFKTDYDDFFYTDEYLWMKDNSYKYGFILRYNIGTEYITGFKFEPWHYRYVGTKLATYLYENNLTLEEYKKKD
ncbi:MAG: M15 family metallopeptidase [Mycoplasmatota bacterium]